jgi:hypothetical protein
MNKITSTVNILFTINSISTNSLISAIIINRIILNLILILRISLKKKKKKINSYQKIK